MVHISYIRDMGFNCIELLPVQEFAMDRSWGYNPASLFAPESSYGSPYRLAHLVDSAHQHGLAIIFDVVYNHAGPGDNVLWEFDGYANLLRGWSDDPVGARAGLVEAGSAGLLLSKCSNVLRGI
jgi:1,4-alpha-glucan branching enzyme